MTYRDRERGGPPQPPLPKPYEFVPLPAGRIPLAQPAGHDRLKADLVHGVLTATLIARSPVHVASGLLEPRRDRDNPLVKAHFRTNGRPAIPGTSLKGCIRSIVEAISLSSVGVIAPKNRHDIPDNLRPSTRRDALDVSQRLFGTLGYQGAIRFADALLLHGNTTIFRSVQLHAPAKTKQPYLNDDDKAEGRKFYMHGKPAEGGLPLEVCPVDSRFELTMHFQNLTRGELGLLLFGLGLGEPRLWPKLGGAKPVCLGTLEVSTPKVCLSTPTERYSSFDDDDHTEVELATLFQEAHARTLVLREQLDKLADILRWPNEGRNCPERNY